MLLALIWIPSIQWSFHIPFADCTLDALSVVVMLVVTVIMQVVVAVIADSVEIDEKMALDNGIDHAFSV